MAGDVASGLNDATVLNRIHRHGVPVPAEHLHAGYCCGLFTPKEGSRCELQPLCP